MHVLSALRDILDRTIAPAIYGFASAGVLCVVAMMIIVTYDVVARYVFNQPSMWAGEFASYLLIAIVFLGLAQNLRQGSHIRIDVVTNLLSVRTRLVLEVIAYAVGIVFSVMLVVGVGIRFNDYWFRQTTADSPLMTELWIPMIPVVLGAAAFSLAMLAGLVHSLHALLTNAPPDPTGPEV